MGLAMLLLRLAADDAGLPVIVLREVLRKRFEIGDRWVREAGELYEGSSGVGVGERSSRSSKSEVWTESKGVESVLDLKETTLRFWR